MEIALGQAGIDQGDNPRHQKRHDAGHVKGKNKLAHTRLLVTGHVFLPGFNVWNTAESNQATAA